MSQWFNPDCGIVYQYPPDGKVHVANMGPTWVLPAPDGPNVGPMNLAIKASIVVMACLFGTNKPLTRTNAELPPW